RYGHDLANRSAQQACNSAETGELDPFLPHLLRDVRRQTGFESRSLHRCIERLQPGRRLPISFAISKSLDVGELDDATLIVDLRHDKTDASDDHMFAESLRQEIDVAHTDRKSVV